MANPNQKRRLRDETASIVAQIHGVTSDYVRKVSKGERENEAIMATLVDYNVGRTRLIKHLEELIPINSNRSRNDRKKN